MTAYLAPEGYVAELVEELGSDVDTVSDRLVLTQAPPRAVAWAANVWFDHVRIEIESIKDGARKLRAIQRNWAVYSHQLHRRAALIQSELPKVSAKPLRFPDPAPTAPLGSWTLLDDKTILAAARCSSVFPNGEANFVEDHSGPPSRAYLKLWEALTVIGRRPAAGERCLDLGASPGGWTWALAGLGARVIAVDKAPLDPAIVRLPGVEQRQSSAFALEPKDVGHVDWLFADIACYPKRLHRLVSTWLESGLVRNFVCTVKFEGKTDIEAGRTFQAIPGSRLMHLHHNKHELTWIKLAS
ncbi:MAG: hypothetical protein EXQ90_04115 [Rhodospirillales bacterium]|nr:hypothetical protein [Rhodospirillales bacterium]